MLSKLAESIPATNRFITNMLPAKDGIFKEKL